MALFTDGPVAGMEDLTAHDSQLLSVASAEGIDVTAKLALSHDAVGIELAGLLGECSGPGLRQVVATPVVRLWHTFRTLEAVYRDAYSSQLNDRYGSKRDQFRGLGDWAREQLRQAGAGIALRPVPRAESPDAQPAAGNLAEGTYYITIGWVNGAGEEGAPSAAVTVACTGGFVVTPRAAPDGVVGWNLYAGMSPESMSRQNAAPVACGVAWEQTSALEMGVRPGSGQAANYLYPLPRRLQRG